MNAETADLQDVYRHRVLAHSRDPHNCRRPDDADREALGFNPLCGDKLSVYLKLDSDDIADISFEGTGCAISIASASMMTDAIQGQSIDNARKMIDEIECMFSDGKKIQTSSLEQLSALEGVRLYPSRIKCATLAWATLDAALSDESTQVSTE